MQLQALLKIFFPILKANLLVLCREIAVLYYQNLRKLEYDMQVKL
jgi:hypothetical protein